MLIFSEWVIGFYQNLHTFNIWTLELAKEKNWRPYPYFQGHFKIKTAKLQIAKKMHIIFRLGQLIFPKFARILYMDMTNLICKVILENEAAKFKPKYLHAHYLCSGSADFTQICMILKSEHDNKPLKFGTLTLFSRSH